MSLEIEEISYSHGKLSYKRRTLWDITDPHMSPPFDSTGVGQKTEQGLE
jgi:hypothetical protein